MIDSRVQDKNSDGSEEVAKAVAAVAEENDTGNDDGDAGAGAFAGAGGSEEQAVSKPAVSC